MLEYKLKMIIYLKILGEIYESYSKKPRLLKFYLLTLERNYLTVYYIIWANISNLITLWHILIHLIASKGHINSKIHSDRKDWFKILKFYFK